MQINFYYIYYIQIINDIPYVYYNTMYNDNCDSYDWIIMIINYYYYCHGLYCDYYYHVECFLLTEIKCFQYHKIFNFIQ